MRATQSLAQMTTARLTLQDSCSLECKTLQPSVRDALLEFFQALELAGDTQNFQPHPFTREAVNSILDNARQDLYYVLTLGNKVAGYGMLRGWDEGYVIPSLGIAIHPHFRNLGLGCAFMHFLHAAAVTKGAEQVRLRVRRDNARAENLYRSLGYVFTSSDRDQEFKVGLLPLRHQSRADGRDERDCERFAD
jgi:[ribosomal protein S18]-alanine N-acetyltransferase